VSSSGSWRQFRLRRCTTLYLVATRAYVTHSWPVRVEMSVYLLTYLLCCFALLLLFGEIKSIINRQRIPRYTDRAVFRPHFSIMTGSGQVGHACSRRTKMKGIDGATRPTAGVRIRTLDRARVWWLTARTILRCGDEQIPRTHLALNLHDITSLRRIPDILSSFLLSLSRTMCRVKVGSIFEDVYSPYNGGSTK